MSAGPWDLHLDHSAARWKKRLTTTDIKLPFGAKFTGFCPQNNKSTRINILLFNLSAASHAYSARKDRFSGMQNKSCVSNDTIHLCTMYSTIKVYELYKFILSLIIGVWSPHPFRDLIKAATVECMKCSTFHTSFFWLSASSGRSSSST